LTVALESAELPKKSWAKVSQIRTLSTARLGRKIGRVSFEEVELVVAGLNEIIAA
jgi:mRNA interferase MazF